MGKKQKRLFLEETYALLKHWNFDVVAHGLSLLKNFPTMDKQWPHIIDSVIR